MKEGPPQRPLTLRFERDILHDIGAARDKEWLVTNGLGVLDLFEPPTRH